MDGRLLAISLLTSLFITPPSFSLEGAVVAQTKVGGDRLQANSSPPISKILRVPSWQIPGATQCGLVIKTNNQQVEGALVQEKALQCSGQPPLADLDFYYSKGDGHLQVNTVLVALKYLSSYSIDGQVFAYQASFVRVDISSDGSRGYRGGVFIINYYDEDGDGKFETRYGELLNLKLPEWYKGR